MINIRETLADHRAVIQRLEDLVPDIETVAHRMVSTIQSEGKILWMGNGGSAADSQHLAAEFVGRFQRERRALASIALTTDTSTLTAVGNDYGYDVIFQRQIEALARPQDVVVGISTSGNSANVLRGIRRAQEMGAFTVGMTGQSGGALETSVDVCLSVPAEKTTRIQEAHILIGHILCDWVETAIIDEHERKPAT